MTTFPLLLTFKFFKNRSSYIYNNLLFIFMLDTQVNELFAYWNKIARISHTVSVLNIRLKLKEVLITEYAKFALDSFCYT